MLTLSPCSCSVYKTFDPRAKVMQSICHQLFKQLDIQ
jgi:citrate synthase